MPSASVIVPCFNEEATVALSLRRLRAALPRAEIIAVDDGSTDGSLARLRGVEGELELTVLVHRENRGKGAAYRTALERVTGDVVGIHDADLELDPADLASLLGRFEYPEVQAVYGSRVLNPDNPRRLSRFYVGGRLVTFIVNLLFGSSLTDAPVCYKVLRTPLARSLNLKGDGFEFEYEMTAKLLKRAIAIEEMPISYSPRTRGEGKKIGAGDGVRGVWAAVSERFR